METPLSLEEIVKRPLWDALVIGAGPAGAFAAYRLSKKRQSVLLLDQADFPRRKVCGGCLSRPAVRLLEDEGLGALLPRLGAKTLDRVILAAGRHRASVLIPAGKAVSREAFDSGLIREAQRAGAFFLPKAKGILCRETGSNAAVRVIRGQREYRLRARLVLVCDGLSGSALADYPELRPLAAPGALHGVAACLDESPAVPEGAILMACGTDGYAGLVRREDGCIEAAAALQPESLKTRTPGACVQAILSGAGIAVRADRQNGLWQGTSLLPRERKIVAGQNFFVLGDAAGFVEPFTGEGIYWALLQAHALSQLLESKHFIWDETLRALWPQMQRKILGRRKETCRQITAVLRRPKLCGWAIGLLRQAPWAAAPLVRAIHGA